MVLVTGFAPFAGSRLNASEEIVRRLDGRRCARSLIVGLILPCAFQAAIGDLQRALRRLRPALVIALGEADRDAITPESLAVNLDHARIPDNRGRQPREAPVIPHAPRYYRTRLPAERIARVLLRRGIPARPSDDAGSFVCNHLFFGLMHELEQHAATRRTAGGFIHVPALRGIARFRLARSAEAVLCAIQLSLRRN